MAYLKLKEFAKAEVSNPSPKLASTITPFLFICFHAILMASVCTVVSQADASCALSLSPEHVKSLQRRAAARLALGKLRAAVGDLIAASALDPTR
jgi:hypothetical protein